MSDEFSPFVESDEETGQADATPLRDPSPHYHSRPFGAAPWVGGFVLIVLGVIFLLRNVGLDFPFLQNWWALFILIPAVSSLSQAWRSYKARGWRFGGHASGSFVGGLALTVVAVTFLFGLSWSLVWPIFLILAGLGALLSGLLSG